MVCWVARFSLRLVIGLLASPFTLAAQAQTAPPPPQPAVAKFNRAYPPRPHQPAPAHPAATPRADHAAAGAGPRNLAARARGGELPGGSD